jgi:hypothetical protein
MYASPRPQPPSSPQPVVIERVPERKRDIRSAVDTDVMRYKWKDGELVEGSPTSRKTAERNEEIGAFEPAPEFLIRSARAQSLVVPSVADEWNREGSIWTYEYEVGKTYQVSSCEAETVRIELAPGEKVLSPPRIGDANGWTVSKPDLVGDHKGHQVYQMYLRPTTEDVGERYLRFGTNLGAYRLHLVVLPQSDLDCMTDVRWQHSDLELARLEAELKSKQAAQEAKQEESAANRADTVGVFSCSDADVNSDYTLELAAGNPSWEPRVCHVVSGEHAIVHIELPRKVAWTQWPQLAVDGGTAAGCRIVREDYMFVCDNLFARAMVSLSARGEQEVFYIRRVIRSAP